MANDDASYQRVMDLLKKLKSEGAEIKHETKSGSPLTDEALSGKEIKPEFDAWVSWTKSF